MSIQAPTSDPPKQPFAPNDAQLARAASLRRFNWLFVYTPLILGSIVVLGLLVWMLWGIFFPGAEETAVFLSGLADIILIFFLIPMLLLGLLGPAALGGIIYYAYYQRQQQRASGEPAPAGTRIQRLFWRLDTLLDDVRAKLDQIYPRIAAPIIKLNSLITYFASLWAQIKQIFKK